MELLGEPDEWYRTTERVEVGGGEGESPDESPDESPNCSEDRAVAQDERKERETETKS